MMTRSPPRRMAARRVMFSRVPDARRDILPFLKMPIVSPVPDRVEACCQLLPRIGRASSVGLATNVWVLVLVSEVEAQVVHHISDVLNDVGTLVEIASSSAAAENLELGDIVWVGSGGKASKDALVGEEMGAAADRQEGPLADGVLLLQLGEGPNKT